MACDGFPDVWLEDSSLIRSDAVVELAQSGLEEVCKAEKEDSDDSELGLAESPWCIMRTEQVDVINSNEKSSPSANVQERQ